MPKKGIIRSNEKTLLPDKNTAAVFNYLNSLKPKGAKKKEICQKTGFSESKVQRILTKLQSKPYQYRNLYYTVKRVGYTYSVVIEDKEGKIVDYNTFEDSANFVSLIQAIFDTNGLNGKIAELVNDSVILYPTKKKSRNQITKLLSDYYKSDIKDIVPVDRVLYLILSTDDRDNFKKVKSSLLGLYWKVLDRI